MRISDWSSDVCSSDLDSIFGPTTIADEQIAFSNQIRDISNKIRTATQNGASDVEIGVLNQQLMKARDSFNAAVQAKVTRRSEEHTSELQSLMRISYAVFCLKKTKSTNKKIDTNKH